MASVKPYVWNKGKPDEREGARIYSRGTGGFVFLALDELTRVSDLLIDIYETRENKDN